MAILIIILMIPFELYPIIINFPNWETNVAGLIIVQLSSFSGLLLNIPGKPGWVTTLDRKILSICTLLLSIILTIVIIAVESILTNTNILNIIEDSQRLFPALSFGICSGILWGLGRLFVTQSPSE